VNLATFPKGRLPQALIKGLGALPFEVAIEPFIAPDSGLPGIRWVARDLKPPIFPQAAELFAQGRSVRDVRKALGISQGEAGRLRLGAAAEGLLSRNGRKGRWRWKWGRRGRLS
jgi:hypothetical protein